MLGAYQLSLATAADDLALPLSEVETTIHGPLANFLTYDRDCRELFLPGQGRIQVCARISEGDKRRIGAPRELEALNSATIRQLVLEEYGIAWDLHPYAPFHKTAAVAQHLRVCTRFSRNSGC